MSEQWQYGEDEPVRMRSEIPQAYTIGEQRMAPPAAPRGSRTRRNWIIGGVVAVIAAAGIAIGVAAFSGPGTIQIHGSINLGFTASEDTTNPDASITGDNLIQAGDACTAASGYTDITPGATVTVGGGSGQSIGVGPLSSGKETSGGYCQFTFSIAVPAGQSAYTVSVSDRGVQTLSAAEVRDGIILTLGV